eukprot:TRINITY_DN2816_c0_g1_i5.p1 TRINITY_DN2816_c0_g1~~TRINITY_DN2816_c0_g1_i5.p1  ORF type:complete len:210 (-),score=26.97 TRINITY_DN2816_c0_g1_i5:39-668(-)
MVSFPIAKLRELFFFLFVISVVSQSDTGCCSPAQWESLATQVNSVGLVYHRIHYDSKNLLVRWDRLGELESTGEFQELHTYTNYNTLREYLYYPKNDTCFIYGPDHFNPWCFGPKYVGQDYIGSTIIAGANCSVWGNEQNQFRWISDDSLCAPVIIQHLNDLTVFDTTTLGIKDPTVFSLPAKCNGLSLRTHTTSHRTLHSFFGIKPTN